MGNIIKCKNGHYYDQDKYGTCPYCRKEGEESSDPLIKGNLSDELDNMLTVAPEKHITSARKAGKLADTVPVETGDQDSMGDQKPWDPARTTDSEERTVGERFEKANDGIIPVTGWLVCVEGAERGQDYRLVTGFNLVGRDRAMDVCIRKDRAISRDTHCSIVYDPKSNRSFIVPGKGTLSYLNGDTVTGPVELKEGDEIQMGRSKFVYVSFCKGDRTWESE